MSRHSTLIFVLLLAATLSVDAVAVYLSTSQDTPNYLTFCAGIAYSALLLSELSIVSTWAVFANQAWGLRWGIPTGITLGAAWLTSTVRYISFTDWCGVFGAHVLMTVILLWLMKNLPLWSRLTGRTERRCWQFGVKHILVVMTLLGVLIVVWRSGVKIRNDWREVAPPVVGSVILAVGATSFSQLRLHYLKRLAALLTFAVGIGAFVTWSSQTELSTWEPAVAFFLIQAIVLTVWLELVPIIPRREPAASAADADQGAEPAGL